MSQARNAHITSETRKQIDQLTALGWYHSIELPDGAVIPGFLSVERLRTRLAQFPIPLDLRGKRVLDIGAWDGWFSFEMERRGAQVVALDSTRNQKLPLARDLLNSKIEYVIADISRVSSKDLGHFDIVLFMGVLYHLKHPLLALENVCEMTDDLACLESYVIDNGEDLSAPPVLEFYEGRELRGQFDNWCGPNTSCLLAMARAAGFASLKLESVMDHRAHVTCLRKWRSEPGIDPPPSLICLENSVSKDHSFSTASDDYISLWFRSGEPALTCDKVYVEAGPYAARPVDLTAISADGWLATCKLPPGIKPQWHDIRLRVAHSQFSNAIRIPVDLSPEERKLAEPVPQSGALRIELVTDGKSWDRWKVKTGGDSCLSIWARGIPDNCDAGQICVRLDPANLAAVFVSAAAPDGLKQINAMLPSGIPPGRTSLTLICKGAASAPVEIELTA
jgi:tRNA (mo5U34)-methyltransferase